MSESYPLLALARRYNIPYRHVLLTADSLDVKLLSKGLGTLRYKETFRYMHNRFKSSEFLEVFLDEVADIVDPSRKAKRNHGKER
jgi:hypothetical protein